MRKQITAVRFYGTLDVELQNLYTQIYSSIHNEEELDLEALTAQTYMRMRQEVSE